MKKMKIPEKNSGSGSGKKPKLSNDPRERRIIQILSGVFKMSLHELSSSVNIRKDTLKLVLKRMEKQGLVVMEKEDKIIYVRFTGFVKEKETGHDDIMYG